MLSTRAEIFDWDAIKEEAFVLPDLTPESKLANDTGAEFKAYIVIPPRSAWEDIGWDHKYLNGYPLLDT